MAAGEEYVKKGPVQHTNIAKITAPEYQNYKKLPGPGHCKLYTGCLKIKSPN